jgi:Cu(I)/Ag(I) efflux system membrane fusion protein
MAGDVIYRIADLSTVWIDGEVFEQDLPSVRLGQQALTTLEALPGEEFTGRVTYVYPVIDPATRTARVRIEVKNPGLHLKPGMYATIRLRGAERSDVLSVPRSAVLSTGERHLVFLKRPNGMLEPRQIVVGVATDDRIEVLRGLAAGDSVVASATFLVDAESNLGSALGGMGDMPGMDMTPPTSGPAPKPREGAVPVRPRQQEDHSAHEGQRREE